MKPGPLERPVLQVHRVQWVPLAPLVLQLLTVASWTVCINFAADSSVVPVCSSSSVAVTLSNTALSNGNGYGVYSKLVRYLLQGQLDIQLRSTADNVNSAGTRKCYLQTKRVTDTFGNSFSQVSLHPPAGQGAEMQSVTFLWPLLFSVLPGETFSNVLSLCCDAPDTNGGDVAIRGGYMQVTRFPQ